MTGQAEREAVERAAEAMFMGGVSDGDTEYTWKQMADEDPARADIWREAARRVLDAAVFHFTPTAEPEAFAIDAAHLARQRQSGSTS